jgi:hypothetical protein
MDDTSRANGREAGSTSKFSKVVARSHKSVGSSPAAKRRARAAELESADVGTKVERWQEVSACGHPDIRA